MILDQIETVPKPAVSPRATRPVKRSFSIRGHRTSISLEQAFWEALNDIASERRISLAQLVSAIDETRGTAGLSGSVRIHILDHYRQRASQTTEAG